MLLLYIIFKICFCMDNKTSCSELLLAIITVVQLSTETDTPKSQGCRGRTSAAFCSVMATGTLYLAPFSSSLFQGGGGQSVCVVSQGIEKNLEGTDSISVPPSPSAPQLSLFPLCCVSLRFAAGGPWGYAVC